MNNELLKRSCIALSVFTLTAIIAAAVFVFSNSRLKTRIDDAYAQIASLNIALSDAERTISEQNTLISEQKTAEPVEEYKPPVTDDNTVYIYDNGTDIIEYPSVEGAVFNDYDMSLLKTDERKRKSLYDVTGKKRSRFGIDVSSYQTGIDWNAVRDDGVEFAVLRAGYRGYESGKIVEDRYFRRNLEGAAAAGIDTGIYFFSQALSEAEAIEEAEYLLTLIEETGADIRLPIVFDWEFPTDEDPARTDGMTGEAQTACCKAFCKVISDAGYEPMYYATVSTAIFRYDMGELNDIPLWIAEYSPSTGFVYKYKMWQYSCSGVVSGIEGLVDLNILIDE